MASSNFSSSLFTSNSFLSSISTVPNLSESSSELAPSTFFTTSARPSASESESISRPESQSTSFFSSISSPVSSSAESSRPQSNSVISLQTPSESSQQISEQLSSTLPESSVVSSTNDITPSRPSSTFSSASASSSISTPSTNIPPSFVSSTLSPRPASTESSTPASSVSSASSNAASISNAPSSSPSSFATQESSVSSPSRSSGTTIIPIPTTGSLSSVESSAPSPTASQTSLSESQPEHSSSTAESQSQSATSESLSPSDSAASGLSSESQTETQPQSSSDSNMQSSESVSDAESSTPTPESGSSTLILPLSSQSSSQFSDASSLSSTLPSSIASVSASTTSEQDPSSTSSSPSNTPSNPSSTHPTTLSTSVLSSSQSNSISDSSDSSTSVSSTLSSRASSSGDSSIFATTSDTSTTFDPVVLTTTSTSILVVTRNGRTATSTSISVFKYTVTPTFDISTVSSEVLATNSLIVSAASAAAAAASGPTGTLPQGPSTGTIVGSVVGSVAGVAIIGIAFLFFFNKHRKRKRDSYISSDSSTGSSSVYMGAGALAPPGGIRDTRPGADSDDEDDLTGAGRRNPGRPPGQKAWWASIIPFAASGGINGKRRRRSLEPLKDSPGPLPEVVGESAMLGAGMGSGVGSGVGSGAASGVAASPDYSRQGPSPNPGNTSVNPTSPTVVTPRSPMSPSTHNGGIDAAVVGAMNRNNSSSTTSSNLTTSSNVGSFNAGDSTRGNSGETDESIIPGTATSGAPRSYYRAPRRLNGNSGGSNSSAHHPNTSNHQPTSSNSSNQLDTIPDAASEVPLAPFTTPIASFSPLPVSAATFDDSRPQQLIVTNPSDPDPRDSVDIDRQSLTSSAPKSAAINESNRSTPDSSDERTPLTTTVLALSSLPGRASDSQNRNIGNSTIDKTPPHNQPQDGDSNQVGYSEYPATAVTTDDTGHMLMAGPAVGFPLVESQSPSYHQTLNYSGNNNLTQPSDNLSINNNNHGFDFSDDVTPASLDHFHSVDANRLQNPPLIPGAREIGSRQVSNNLKDRQASSQPSNTSNNSTTSENWSIITPETQHLETFQTPPQFSSGQSSHNNNSDVSVTHQLNGDQDYSYNTYNSPITPPSVPSPAYLGHRAESSNGSGVSRQSDKIVVSDSPSGGIGGILGVGRNHSNNDSEEEVVPALQPSINDLASKVNDNDDDDDVYANYNRYSAALEEKEKENFESQNKFSPQDDREESVPVLRSTLSKSPRVVEQSPVSSVQSYGGSRYGSSHYSGSHYGSLPSTPQRYQFPLQNQSGTSSVSSASVQTTNLVGSGPSLAPSFNTGSSRSLEKGFHNGSNYTLRSVVPSSSHKPASASYSQPGLQSVVTAPTLGHKAHSSLSNVGNTSAAAACTLGNLNVGNVSVGSIGNGSNSSGSNYPIVNQPFTHNYPNMNSTVSPRYNSHGSTQPFHPVSGSVSPTPWQATIHHVDSEDDGTSNKSASSNNVGNPSSGGFNRHSRGTSGGSSSYNRYSAGSSISISSNYDNSGATGFGAGTNIGTGETSNYHRKAGLSDDYRTGTTKDNVPQHAYYPRSTHRHYHSASSAGSTGTNNSSNSINNNI